MIPVRPNDPSYGFWQQWEQGQGQPQARGPSPLQAYNTANTAFGSGQTLGQQGAGWLGSIFGPSMSAHGVVEAPGAVSGGSLGGSMFGSGAGGSAAAAAESNPVGWFATLIAANELAGHGKHRRPGSDSGPLGGWANQLKFDLMGKAPGADVQALSDKWLGHGSDFGHGLSQAVDLGANLDPRDQWKDLKGLFGGIF